MLAHFFNKAFAQRIQRSKSNVAHGNAQYSIINSQCSIGNPVA